MTVYLGALLNGFWRICLLRQSPQHIPSNFALTAVLIVASIAMSLAFVAKFDAEFVWLRALTMVIVHLTSTVALIWLALALRDLSHRLTTTVTASLGCDLIVTLLGFVALTLIGQPLEEPLPQSLLLLLQIWILLVYGFILGHALNIRTPLGVCVAFGITIFSLAISTVAVQT